MRALRRTRVVAAIVLAGSIALACGSTLPGTPSAVVERWLLSAAGATEDRGWSLLYPELQVEMFGGDASAYVAAAAASDWSRVSFRVVEEYWDDPGFGVARLEVADLDAVPPFLTARHGNYTFMQSYPPEGGRVRAWNAELAVRRNGSVRVFASGG